MDCLLDTTQCQLELGVGTLAPFKNLGLFPSPKSESLSSLPSPRTRYVEMNPAWAVRRRVLVQFPARSPLAQVQCLQPCYRVPCSRDVGLATIVFPGQIAS